MAHFGERMRESFTCQSRSQFTEFALCDYKVLTREAETHCCLQQHMAYGWGSGSDSGRGNICLQQISINLRLPSEL